MSSIPNARRTRCKDGNNVSNKIQSGGKTVWNQKPPTTEADVRELIEDSLHIAAISPKDELSRAAEMAPTGGLEVTGGVEVTGGERSNFDAKHLKVR
ncbi:MAG: hypothetical protein JRF28_02435 [Deltaproteobacteria bacterium]|nr:hypothetical protein [Deltaproteobacteria bacterium]